MFRKIFLSLWLTIALVAIALQMLLLWQRDREQRSNARMRVFVVGARRAADAYERGDAARAAVETRAIDRATGASINVLDERGASIVNRPVRDSDRAAARVAERIAAAGFSAPFGDARTGIIAQSFNATSGHSFTLIVVSRRAFPWPPILRSPYISLFAVLVLGGFVCFGLARHFAVPLTRLGEAANAVADGRLGTRVSAQLSRRRDEIGALARDFDRMAERIEALVSADRRFLGEMSHQLRSPLARVTVALTLARKSQGDEYLGRIDREVERLDRLVGQLLTLARIDSGVENTRGHFDLAGLLREIVSDGDFEARAHGRRVDLVAADAHPMFGCEEPLRDAVENVVRNAIRHTAEGTSVEVTLRDGRLTVRDHGPGIPEPMIAEIFTPFWRSPSETTEGTGLGLAIAERIVRAHEGSIRASNAEGGGMIVTIELPR
jgi:two-component system sensor histidine kinase CpxA